MKILLVEDDQNLAQLILLLLTKQLEARVTVLDNGWKALDQSLAQKYDLIILDLMLPGLNGLEICRKIRQRDKLQPILILTAKAEEQDKLDGFETGADDYLTKPFSQPELMARIKALLRRTSSKDYTSQINVINIDELSLDAQYRTLKKNNSLIDLTAKEFDLIHFFMKHPGRAFTRLQLLDEVWGQHFEGLEHTVNSTINRLRIKIEKDLNKPEYILTAWGIGYRFKEY